jgi:hypothetical protein
MAQGTSIVVALLAGALGGVLGGLASGWVRPHPPEPKPAAADYAEDVRDLAAKVAALDAAVARLEQQRRTAGVSPTVGAAARPSTDAPAKGALTDDPVFEAAVRDVMEKMQQERAKERDDRREAAAQRWADQLGDKLALTDAQKAGVLGVAQDLLQKLRDLRDADPGAPQGPGWREQRAALVAQGEQRLGELLSSRQMATYKDSPDLHLDAVLRAARGGRGGQ